MRRWGESVGARGALCLCCNVWHDNAPLASVFAIVFSFLIYSIVMSTLMEDDLYFFRQRGSWEWKTASLL